MEMGFPPRIVWFINQMVGQRSLQFVINEEISSLYNSYKGVPQGLKASILNPLLFNIYTIKCKNAL